MTAENLLDFVLNEKQSIFDEIKEKISPEINLINSIKESYDEVNNSILLFNLFKFNAKINNEDLNIARKFAEKYISNIDNTHISVFNEYAISSGRLDLFIKNASFQLIIENKINADEQEAQLERYYKELSKNQENTFIIYLTIDGKEPSEKSLSPCMKDKLLKENRLICLSHENIGDFINNDIIEKFPALTNKKYQSLYSALIQIRDNEYFISNINREKNMSKEIIKNHLEKNEDFKKEMDLNKIDKYAILFDAVSEEIYNKKLDFYKQLVAKLKEKYTNIETTDNNENTYHIVFKDVCNCKYFHLYIKYSFSDKKRIREDVGVYHYCEDKDNDKMYKILQNHCDGAWHDGEYVYYFGINNELKSIEVKTPENMAAKIIDIINAISDEFNK
ncbi:PD-(D/E)XK nuclease family protein [Brachyspira pulli]|uniref:PD-(D/E)XK nuclease family protein n=1 Tax=Brachyspira pulli TaxID=310721 RepID=UPI00300446D2